MSDTNWHAEYYKYFSQYQDIKRRLAKADLVIKHYGDEEMLQGGMCDARGLSTAWDYMDEYKLTK